MASFFYALFEQTLISQSHRPKSINFTIDVMITFRLVGMLFFNCLVPALSFLVLLLQEEFFMITQHRH